MEDYQLWQQQNLAWRSEHRFWLEEVDKWTRQTKQLIALLHKLEQALPEHSTRLDQHVARIIAHEAEIKRHECGLDPRCFKDCDNYVDIGEQRRFHKKLSGLHEVMQQQHGDFSKRYALQMQQFREIAKQLIAELGEDD